MYETASDSSSDMKNILLFQGKETWKQLEQVSRFGYSHSTIISDFLDTCLFLLLSLTDNMKDKGTIDKLLANKLTGKCEDEYMKLIDKYKENKNRPRGERPADYFQKAWSCLLKETHEYDHDILGEIYEAQISHGENGQFFTLVHICDFMARVVGSPSPSHTVNDPTCGRFFISMGKLSKDLFFVGMDIAPVCVKMATLNMWLFDLDADIYCGDKMAYLQVSSSLQNKKRRLYIRGGHKTEPESVKIEMEKQVNLREQETLFDLSELKKKAA